MEKSREFSLVTFFSDVITVT